jgi:hypothetical protein
MMRKMMAPRRARPPMPPTTAPAMRPVEGLREVVPPPWLEPLEPEPPLELPEPEPLELPEPLEPPLPPVCWAPPEVRLAG